VLIKITQALADDFDTPKAMRALASLAAAGEAYLLAKESDLAACGDALANTRTRNIVSVPPEPLALCARLVAKTSSLFGVESVATAYMPASANTNSDATDNSNNNSASNTSAGETLHALTDFRAEVRAAAKRALIANAKAAKAAKKAAAKDGGGVADDDDSKYSDTVAGSALAQELLEICDKLRDEVLPEKLGVVLEDRPSGKAHVTSLRK